MERELVFGFLPAQVLQDVNELGNWKTRSCAIDQLQHGLANLGPSQAQLLQQQLPQFMAFMLQLLQDHNFKVVAAGLNVLASAANTLGAAMQPHISALTPALHSKLLDQRPPVAAAAVKAATTLMKHALPNKEALLANSLLQQHEAGGAAARHDCSAVLEVVVWALLTGPVTSLDTGATARLLLSCVHFASADSSSSIQRQHALALEALALVTDAFGPQLPEMLKQSGASDLTVSQVLREVHQLERPVLAADGSIRHNGAVQAATAAANEAAAAAAGAGSLGSTGSFRLGSSMHDLSSRASLSSNTSRNSSIFSRIRSASKIGMEADGTSAVIGAQEALTSGPLGGWRQQQQQQQLMPPGSLGALAAHAQLISSASSSIAAAAAASGGGGDSSRAGGANTGGSSGMGRDGSASGLVAAGLRSHALETRGHGDWLEQLEAPGSPRAQDNTSSSRNSTLRGLHTNSSIRTSGGSISSMAAAARQDAHPAQDAAAAVAAAAQHVSTSSNGSSSSIVKVQAGLWGAAADNGLNHRYEAQHQQYQEQLDNSSHSFRWSADQGPRQADAATSAGNAPNGSPGSLDQPATTSGAAHGNGSSAGAGAGSGGGIGSSWLTSMGWATPDSSAGDAASAQYCPGRVEALSPSRGERLANLKRRQVEKRASSALGGTRGPWDSGEGSVAAAVSVVAGGDPAAAADVQLPRAATAGPAVALSGSSGRMAPLLNWHIPTGSDGQVMAPGASTSLLHQQQGQQQGQRGLLGGSYSPVPCSSSSLQGTLDSGPPMSPSPTPSWGSSLSASRQYTQQQQHHGGTMSATTAQQYSSGLQQPQQYRAVSAAAVLTADGSTDDGSSSGNSGSSRHVSSNAGGTMYRSSRFQLQRVPPPASAAPPGTSAASATPTSPRGTSRFSSSLGLGAQTAAAAVAMPAGEWGASSSGNSSPSSRLGSASGPMGSGCFGGAAAAGLAQSHSGQSSAGSAGSPSRCNMLSTLRGVSGLERPQSVGTSEVELDSMELAPLADPEGSLRQVISKCQQANSAARKELDWQGQLEALVDARRLAAQHPEVLRPAARELMLAVLPAVDELRSTTARMALLFFQELPAVLGRSIERELDEVAPVLLKKAGDLSTAGRDNFLAQQADKALSAICGAVSEVRALSALIAAGAAHKSPHVRSRAAAHLDEVAAEGRGLAALLRSGNWAVLDKVFKTAAGFLQEGSLDTRTYGKRLLWAVKTVLRGNRPDMDRLMTGVTPEALQRRVVEVLEGLAAPPPPPTNRGSSAAGPRLASRGQSSGSTTPISNSFCGLPPPPYSAPASSSSAAAAAGFAAVGQEGPLSASKASGGSSLGTTGGGAARRALFSNNGSGSSNSSSNGSGPPPAMGLRVQGAPATAAAVGSAPGSPSLSASNSRRRRSTATSEREGVGGAAGVSSSSSPTLTRDSSSNGSNGSWCVVPAGPSAPMSPELQEAVDQVGQHLCSKDWRNRMDALRALSALQPALPEVPNAALEGLLQALTGRLSDGNAKVNQKALEVLPDIVGTIGLRTLLVMPSLMPALTANLGSTNERLRACASSALDAVAASVAPQPQLLLQGLALAVTNGSMRTKLAVIEKLNALLPQAQQVQPGITKLVLPAAFSLASEARGEVRGAVAQLLSTLAALMGSSALLGAAAVVSSAVEQRVRELLLGYAGRAS